MARFRARLVLSTPNANSPEGALTRLKNLGVSDYAIEASLRGVMSQRLEPEVCGECGGEGCNGCGRTGVAGVLLKAHLTTHDLQFNRPL